MCNSNMYSKSIGATEDKYNSDVKLDIFNPIKGKWNN